MKKFILSAVLALLCAGSSFAADIPVLRCSYGITTHQQAFMVAMSMGEDLKDLGVWLTPVVPKEKYDLMVNGEKVARLNVIVTKSGSEATSLFAQDHLDLTVNSFPAMLSGIDRGTKIKVLGPLQADGIAMVSRNDIDVKDGTVSPHTSRRPNAPSRSVTTLRPVLPRSFSKARWTPAVSALPATPTPRKRTPTS